MKCAVSWVNWISERSIFNSRHVSKRCCILCPISGHKQRALVCKLFYLERWWRPTTSENENWQDGWLQSEEKVENYKTSYTHSPLDDDRMVFPSSVVRKESKWAWEKFYDNPKTAVVLNLAEKTPPDYMVDDVWHWIKHVRRWFRMSWTAMAGFYFILCSHRFSSEGQDENFVFFFHQLNSFASFSLTIFLGLDDSWKKLFPYLICHALEVMIDWGLLKTNYHENYSW